MKTKSYLLAITISVCLPLFFQTVKAQVIQRIQSGQIEYRATPIPASGGGHYIASKTDKKNGDIYIVKYNSSGTKVWENFYGGDSTENLASAIEDSWGNVVVIYSKPDVKKQFYLMVIDGATGAISEVRKIGKTLSPTYNVNPVKILQGFANNNYFVLCTAHDGTDGKGGFIIEIESDATDPDYLEVQNDKLISASPKFFFNSMVQIDDSQWAICGFYYSTDVLSMVLIYDFSTGGVRGNQTINIVPMGLDETYQICVDTPNRRIFLGSVIDSGSHTDVSISAVFYDDCYNLGHLWTRVFDNSSGVFERIVSMDYDATNDRVIASGPSWGQSGNVHCFIYALEGTTGDFEWAKKQASGVFPTNTTGEYFRSKLVGTNLLFATTSSTNTPDIHWGTISNSSTGSYCFPTFTPDLDTPCVAVSCVPYSLADIDFTSDDTTETENDTSYTDTDGCDESQGFSAPKNNEQLELEEAIAAKNMEIMALKKELELLKTQRDKLAEPKGSIQGTTDMITAYPNPNSGITTVSYEITGIFKTASLVVCNELGQQVAEYPVQQKASGSTEINVTTFGAGIYYCKLKVDNAVRETVKFVVIK